MNKLKKYGKTVGIFLLCLLIISLLISLFNSFGLIKTKTTDLFIMIFMIICFLFFGITYGLKASKKGYLEGLKIGLIFVVILNIINIIFFQSKFTFARIIYYLVLILVSIFGSMIGINRKK